jgi:hypothetical protein
MADAIARSRTLVDPQLTAAVSEPARALQTEIQAASLPEARFWRSLNAFAYQLDNNGELAAMALRKSVGTTARHEPLAVKIAAHIATLENAVRNALPGLVDELALRARPLRELWEACGPGLLRAIGQLTDERLIVDSADVVLVYPALGGGGAAHLINNSVRIEAVLTNNIPQLPETVRLAWLVAQLNQDVPMFGERLHSDRLPLVAGLAMLPAVLAAGSELELCRCDPAAVALAISAWHPELPSAESTADVVNLWWQTYQLSRTPWSTALAALDQMLAGTSPGDAAASCQT